MSKYQLTWITNNLAVGNAPMSHSDLEMIKEQGVNAIVNLCDEFCDLHEIEEKTGFEVYYLPIPDESAPDLKDMEKALAWLDEAIYLGKKVLVHCRFGIGRTGTFVTAYLLRRGLGLKIAAKKLKHTRANPTNYSQYKLVKQYGKQSGTLTIREPSLEIRQAVDLGPYFTEYEAIVQKIKRDIESAGIALSNIEGCGLETNACCFDYFDMQLAETIYLNNIMNRTLASDVRAEVIHKAVKVNKKTRKIRKRLDKSETGKQALIAAYTREKILCPLNKDGRCLLYAHRPIQCRLFNIPGSVVNREGTEQFLLNVSKHVLFAFSGFFLDSEPLSFSVAETVSGKFVQEYFYYLAAKATEDEASVL